MLSSAQVFLLTPCASQHRMRKSFHSFDAISGISFYIIYTYIHFKHKIFLILFWHNLIFGVRHCIWGVYFDCTLILYAGSRKNRDCIRYSVPLNVQSENTTPARMRGSFNENNGFGVRTNLRCAHTCLAILSRYKHSHTLSLACKNFDSDKYRYKTLHPFRLCIPTRSKRRWRWSTAIASHSKGGDIPLPRPLLLLPLLLLFPQLSLALGASQFHSFAFPYFLSFYKGNTKGIIESGKNNGRMGVYRWHKHR